MGKENGNYYSIMGYILGHPARVLDQLLESWRWLDFLFIGDDEILAKELS